MSDKHAVIEKIRVAFARNEYPGDDFLQGSFEGCEPDEEVSPFRGKRDPEADTTALEREIDQLVYKLYDLAPEEIAIVEEATRGK